jgi:arabinogalactan endo-1,4-beta-galactosidase
MKKLLKHAKPIVIICLFLLGIIPRTIPARAATDTSNILLLDPTRWEAQTNGGAQITQESDITITSNPKYDISRGEVSTAFQFTGDFDVQVDYREGMGWTDPMTSYRGNPHLDAAEMGINVDGSIWLIRRTVFPTNPITNFLSVDSIPAGQERRFLYDYRTSAETSGKYRIIRSGSEVEFQYYKDTNWVSLYSISGITNPASIYLSATSVYTNHTFSTIFDNFQINSGKTNYIPLVWKETFPKRIDFMVGGWVNDYLWSRNWGNYYKETNPWQIMKENGVQWANIWVTNVHTQDLADTPVEKWGTLMPKAEYWASQEYAEENLKEAQDAGLRLYLTLVLGDAANTAGIQNAPSAWKGLSVTETAKALENYTYETAMYYKSKGLNIEMYDVGNEIETGILNFRAGERISLPAGVDPNTDLDYMRNNVWNIEAQLLKSGIAGVRRADPNAKIVLHTYGLGGGASAENLENAFFQAMVDEGVDFDYAGISHPVQEPYGDSTYWPPNQYANHTWFQHMNETISFLAGIGKKTLICYAAYPESSEGITYDPMPDYPYTPEGQAAWLRDQLLFASNNKDVVGWFYFYPDSFPGFNSDPSQTWVNSMGLFINDGIPQPAMSEFLLGRKPAAFEFSRLTVNPTQVEVNSPITISVNVKNTGGISGIYSVELKMNGVVEESKRVTLDGGTQTDLSFTITKAIAGSYKVDVGTLSGIFTVKTQPKPASIDVKSLVISKALVKKGEEVTVNATLENNGDLTGTYNLAFSLDGVQKDSATVILDGGKTTSRLMKFSSGVEGGHIVMAGNESVAFEVEKTPVAQTGIDGYPIESVFIGLVLVILIRIASRKSHNVY